MTQPMPGNAEEHQFQLAYEKVLDEMKAVPHSDYVSINTDVPTAVITVLGALPKIKALRPRVVADLPNLDIARFDKFETYAMALGHAHARYMVASHPVEALEAMSEEASALRELMVADANTLALRALIDRDALKQLKGNRGYSNVAFDLLALAQIFRDKWPVVQGKCALQLDEINRAQSLGTRIARALGEREQAPTKVVEAAEMRQRAYTLFIRAYEHAQRALRFLRWEEEDWETILPSIYNASRSRRKETEGATAPTTPAQPATAGASRPATNGPSPGVGMPNSDPFAAG
ncbi:MAG: hypothetical protein ABW133_03730 [Polyangiaceae bacterium]